MDVKLYKVDLHVHTPASKCYMGDKTEEGYWKILKSAVENDVRIIAITDHNTIEGYEKLIQLKENTLREYEIIKKYDIPEQQKADLIEKVKLFGQVSIILGVEITLNPGVHIIVLCDEESKSDLCSLLDEIGYTSDKRGSDSDIVPEMDIKTFLSNPLLSEKLIIAPHIDSDKGIWNTLEGTYRAAIFKSSVISAITCNNAKQLESVKELTRTDPNYKRNVPFVCINASDAHKQGDIGSKHSYFKLSNFTFTDLRKAFDFPEECISDTEKQDFIDYVKRCSEYKATIYIKDINQLEMSCYAMLNNGYGCILLGITEVYQQQGIAISCKDIENTVEQVFNKIQENNNMRYLSYKCTTEPLGNGKSVGAIIIVSEERKLWVTDTNVLYIYDGKNSYKLATIREVEDIISNRILAELQNFEERNNDNIWDAMVKMQHSLNPISKFSIYNKIKSDTVPITYYFDLNHFGKLNGKTICTSENGEANGNVYYINSTTPRLDDAYLRYSCPVYENSDEEYLIQLLEINSPSIVITFGGGCHIIDIKGKSYFDCNAPAVMLKPNERFYKDNISLYHIIAWLKSDCFIWTCLQRSSDINIYNPKTLFNCFVPYKREYYDNNEIEEKVKEILSLEQVFLKEFPTNASVDNIDFAKKMCNKHNDAVNRKASEIEKIIKNLICIDDDENEMITNDLSYERIFVYDQNEIMQNDLFDQVLLAFDEENENNETKEFETNDI